MIRSLFKNVTAKGKGMLVLSILFFVLCAVSGTSMMLLIIDMVEKLTREQPVELSHYWLILAGLMISKQACNLMADITKHHTGFNVGEKIRIDMLNRLKRFSLGFYTKKRIGEISTVIQKDVTVVEHVVAHMWSRMTSDFIVALIFGTGLFIVDWRMGLAMISFLPLAICVLVHGIRSGKKFQKSSQDDLADMVSLFIEYVKGIPLLKAFNESTEFQRQLQESTKSFGKSSRDSSKNIAGYLGRYSLFLELSFAVLATLGAYFVFGNSLSVFNYLIFIIISREFYKPFAGMEGHWLGYLKLTDSYKRIQSVMESPVIDQPKYPKMPGNYDITFNNVGFFYKKGEFELHNASFYLRQGTLTALVGPSGAGKTTITSLLLRFWEPQKGEILIGGVDIREIDYDDLLSNISIVMQNVILFADTIEGNIKIGNSRATREEVIEAARQAMIHEFIMSLPQGYDTPVGENGVGLSGGQKQRISIARAFMKNSPIVILDEITSNVDPVNEAKIQQAISNLAKDRTVLVIAHRLNTIRTADTIRVFNNGRIVESGKHEELLKSGSLYKSLWDSQEQAKKWQLANAPMKVASCSQ